MIVRTTTGVSIWTCSRSQELILASDWSQHGAFDIMLGADNIKPTSVPYPALSNLLSDNQIPRASPKLSALKHASAKDRQSAHISIWTCSTRSNWPCRREMPRSCGVGCDPCGREVFRTPIVLVLRLAPSDATFIHGMISVRISREINVLIHAIPGRINLQSSPCPSRIPAAGWTGFRGARGPS